MGKLRDNLCRLPWLLAAKIREAAHMADYRRIAMIGSGARVMNDGLIINAARDPSRIRIGDHSLIRGEICATGAGGVTLGDWCFVGPGSCIWGGHPDGLSIGDRVLISHQVNIHDTDSHALDPMLRHEHFTQIAKIGHPSYVPGVGAARVVIEDDVWIGHGATISKGVRIGRGAVIGHDTVVLRDVEPWTVVAGNPARLIRRIDEVRPTVDWPAYKTEWPPKFPKFR